MMRNDGYASHHGRSGNDPSMRTGAWRNDRRPQNMQQQYNGYHEPSTAAVDQQIAALEEDIKHALVQYSEKQTKTFDLIFEILSSLQGQHSQLEGSIQSLVTHYGGGQMQMANSGQTWQPVNQYDWNAMSGMQPMQQQQQQQQPQHQQQQQHQQPAQQQAQQWMYAQAQAMHTGGGAQGQQWLAANAQSSGNNQWQAVAQPSGNAGQWQGITPGSGSSQQSKQQQQQWQAMPAGGGGAQGVVAMPAGVASYGQGQGAQHCPAQGLALSSPPSMALDAARDHAGSGDNPSAEAVAEDSFITCAELAGTQWDKNRIWQVVNVDSDDQTQLLNVTTQAMPFAPGSGRLPPKDILVGQLRNGDLVKQIGHSKKVRGHMVMPVQLEELADDHDEAEDREERLLATTPKDTVRLGWTTRRVVGGQIWFEELGHAAAGED